MEATLAIAALLLLVIANGWATRVALRDPHSERHQKTAQCLAIWLLPVLGAIFVFALHRKPEPPAGYRDSAETQLDGFADGKRVGRAIGTQADD